MAEPMQVGEHERGIVRVFAIDAPADEQAAWLDPAREDWPLPAALGLERLDPADVQVFRARDVAEIGLSGFLAAGHEIDDDQLAPDRAALDAETGPVAVIRSGAVEAPATLRPEPPLRLLGVYAEPSAPLAVAELGAHESAKPRGAPRAEAAEPPASGRGLGAATFRPDRETYIRDHFWLAALGMAGATGVLWAIDNAHPWVGAVAAMLAVGVRGAYLASEELGLRWEMTAEELRAVSAEERTIRSVPLSGVARVRRLGSAVQIVTSAGDKVLLRYLADPEGARDRIARAAGVAP